MNQNGALSGYHKFCMSASKKGLDFTLNTVEENTKDDHFSIDAKKPNLSRWLAEF